MKQFRRIVFWCHLVTGVTVGLVVLVLAATGVLMSFERQIVEWVDMRGLDSAASTAGAAPLSPDDVLRALPDSLGRVTSITWRAGDRDPVAATFGRDRTVFVDSHSGDVIGEPNREVRAFFDGVLGVHRWLAVSDDARGFGRSVTGLCNLALLFMVFTGVFLWWPRNWKNAAVKNVVLFRSGLSRKARKFNRHNVLGIWSALPLFLIAATGVMISYPAAGDAMFAVYERLASEGNQAGVAERTPARANEMPDPKNLGDMKRIASDRVPDWRRLTLIVPGASDERVEFQVDRGTGGQPQKTAELIFDRSSGAVARFTPFGRESAGTQFFETIRYVHTGEVFGVVGQTIAGLVSLAVIFLIWTGLTLAWMRGLRALRRRSREPT